jgi:hypothetical protein
MPSIEAPKKFLARDLEKIEYCKLVPYIEDAAGGGGGDVAGGEGGDVAGAGGGRGSIKRTTALCILAYYYLFGVDID